MTKRKKKFRVKHKLLLIICGLIITGILIVVIVYLTTRKSTPHPGPHPVPGPGPQPEPGPGPQPEPGPHPEPGYKVYTIDFAPPYSPGDNKNQQLYVYFTEEDGTYKRFTYMSKHQPTNAPGVPDTIPFDTGDTVLQIQRFEDICPNYEQGQKCPALNKNYTIIPSGGKTAWSPHAFLIKGPISLKCSNGVDYWTNKTAVFWACIGSIATRRSNFGGGIVLPGLDRSISGGIDNIFRQQNNCKFVEILWGERMLKIHSNNSKSSPMPITPIMLGYKKMNNIPYLPYTAYRPSDWSMNSAGSFMCVPMSTLTIDGVSSKIMDAWNTLMKTQIYTYNKGNKETYEAVLALCDTGGELFLINDPGSAVPNIISELKKQRINKQITWCPGGAAYGTVEYPFPQWSAKFGKDCENYPEQCTEITIPEAPTTRPPKWQYPGAAIGPDVSGGTFSGGCGTARNTVNLGPQLFVHYDVIIDVQTPKWWETIIANAPFGQIWQPWQLYPCNRGRPEGRKPLPSDTKPSVYGGFQIGFKKP